MYELKQIGKNTYYIDCPAKIGLYRLNNSEVCLIDTGNDTEAGKKILRILEENDWKLKYIINTHSNADHIGGNAYLQEKTGCKIYSSGIEQAFTNYPFLESSFLYGGFPFKELQNKFLLARPSKINNINELQLPGFKIINLPGHFFGMIGIITPDNIFFIADSLVSERIINKYHISFIYDIDAYLNTLKMLETLEAEYIYLLMLK
jgi:glyoxylase-like metal-dependent hydrolase (beta-lactamase superfamily II)